MMTYKVWRVEDIVSGMHRGRLATYTSCYGDIGLTSLWHGEQLRPVPRETRLGEFKAVELRNMQIV